MAAGYNIDPVTGEMVLSPDGAVPMPAAMGGGDPLGSSVGMNPPYGPQYPHYGPGHAGGAPSRPIIPGPGFGASAGSVLQQTSPNRALNLGYGAPGVTYAPAPQARARAPAVQRIRALPQVLPGGASGVVPSWKNPAYGAGANVGLGN
jgi:hypothetical protein